MIKEFIENVILRNRPEQIDVQVYGNYGKVETKTAVYSDADKRYDYKTKGEKNKKVRSAKAFVEYIKEELRRRENKDGHLATVQLNLEGGNFTADEEFNRGNCAFERLHSEQYEYLQHYNKEVLDHEQFLIMLQRLKPSIQNFADIFDSFSKIRILGRSESVSNPIFDTNGNAESSYKCSYKLTDGTTDDVSLPAEFFVEVPFVKAGEKKYTYHIELLFFNTNSNRINVKVQVTDFETNEEQAIIDEAKDIKEQLKDYPKLLVLADF